MQRLVKIRLRLTLLMLLLMNDIGAFCISLCAALAMRILLGNIITDMPIFTLQTKMLSHGAWVALLVFFFFANNGLYTKRLPFWDETKRIVGSLTFAVLIALAVVTLAKLGGSVSRVTLIVFWCFSVLLFPLSRYLLKKRLYARKRWQTNILILGAGSAGTLAASGLFAQTYMGYHVVGFLDDDTTKLGRVVQVERQRIKVLGRIADLPKFVKRAGIDTVLVAMPSLPANKLSEIVNNAHKIVKKILIVPDFKGVALSNTEFYNLFNEKLFLVGIQNNLESTVNIMTKRVFDIVVSSLLMPILLPLFAILSVLIKLDSPGHVLYRHERIGEGGQPFGVFKFRSMYQDSKERLERILASDESARMEWESSFKLKNDPRVTRIGAFLRKTSLDELPQILNVFAGQMSLVGPRPVIQKEIDNYYGAFAEYYFLVRPGITGLWQVSGRSDMEYDARIRLDSWYVLNWSLWLDIVILLKTVKVVLRREGAY